MIEDGGFEEQAKLTAADAFADDNFGYGLSLSGGTLAVGAPWKNGDGGEEGGVYIFSTPPISYMLIGGFLFLP